jgi:hypothetical protein
MTTGRNLFVRIHARIHGERGFALIETVIALGIIFASLMLLAYAGSAGFGYSALARERQAATGVANEIMESVRALAWERLTEGLSSSDLGGDPLIVDCSGVYRFEDCSGEAIVHSPGLTDQCPAPADPCPLVPHRGTVSGDGYPTSYDWAVYVTNDDPDTEPYRVTVIVSWTGGRVQGAAKSTRAESLFYAPEGCGTSDTHPFAGPCQPTYTGVAEASGGSITFTNLGAGGANFTTAQIVLPAASANADMEQVPAVDGRADQERVFASTGSSAGGASTTSVADAIPTTPAGEYQANAFAPTSGSVAVIPGTSTSLSLLNGAGSSGSSVSATAPVSTTVAPCPLTATPFTQQTDGWPCGASMSRSNATVAAILSLTSLTPHNLGTATLATVGAPASGTQSVAAMINREDPPSAEEGIRTSVSRAFGKVQLFALPSGLSSGFPANWTSGSSDFTGYVLTLQNYADSASAAAGPTTNAPTSGVVGTPTLHYWNGTGYSSVSGAAFNTAGSRTVATAAAGPVRMGSGADRRWYCAYVQAGTIRWGGALAASTATPRTSATGLIGSPLTATVRYRVSTHNSDPGACTGTGGTANVDLTVTVDLGSLLARSRYRPAPTGG